MITNNAISTSISQHMSSLGYISTTSQYLSLLSTMSAIFQLWCAVGAQHVETAWVWTQATPLFKLYVNLTGPQGAQIFGQCLSVSARVFLDEINL